jgi:hypothetical protein
MKRALRIFIRFFVAPTLFVHELCHYIVALLMFVKPSALSFTLQFFSGLPNGSVIITDDKIFDKIKGTIRFLFINIAPLISWFTVGILAFYFTSFKFILIYQIITFNWSFLSEGDLDNALSYFNVMQRAKIFKLRRFENWLYRDGLNYDDNIDPFIFMNE